MVLPVEGCEFGYIEGAAVYVGIIGIIEPETNVEAIGRRQTGVRIKSEDLIQQDRLDRGLEMTLTVGLKVSLIPSHAKAASETHIGIAVRKQVAALDRKHIECEMRFNVVALDGKCVVQISPRHGYVGGGSRATWCSQTREELRVRVEIELNDLDLRCCHR